MSINFYYNKLTYLLVGNVHRCHIAASRLAKDNALAHVALPVGPGCYHPPREPITVLHEDVTKYRSKPYDAITASCLKHLRYWRSAYTYNAPSNPETDITRPNLNLVMNLVVTSIPEHSSSTRFKVISASDISNEMSYFFAGKLSLPEPLVVYQLNGKCFGLVASEAKGVEQSMLVTYAQAVQLASDCAVILAGEFEKRKMAVDVAVPFVTTSWDDIQFGVVYLVDGNYPCTTLLSRRLSLNNEFDLLEICCWIRALSQHCLRVRNLLVTQKDTTISSSCSSATSSSSSIVSSSKRQKLEEEEPISLTTELSTDNTIISVSLPSAGKYLYKPVCLRSGLEPYHFRSTLSSLLSRFYDLFMFDNGALREIVVFPAGVLAYPPPFQDEMINFLQKRLQELPQMKESGYDEVKCVVGYPIVLYPYLDKNIWKRSDNMIYEKDNVIKSFLAAVANACTLLERAGIIHTDLRQGNIFYRIGSGSALVQAEPAVPDPVVSIKIVDWDDSLRLNEVIPTELVRQWISNPSEFMQVSEDSIITSECHKFFIRKLELYFKCPLG